MSKNFDYLNSIRKRAIFGLRMLSNNSRLLAVAFLFMSPLSHGSAHADVVLTSQNDGTTVFSDIDDPSLPDPDPTVLGLGGNLSGNLNFELSANGNSVVDVTGANLSGNSIVFAGNSTLNVSGGSVTGFLFLQNQATANISGGTVSGLEVFATGFGTTTSPNINISGGNVSSFGSFDSADIVISGGSFSTLDVFLSDGSLEISGGSLDATSFFLSDGAQATISGGTLQEVSMLDISGSGSALNLIGDFILITNNSDTLDSIGLPISTPVTGTITDIAFDAVLEGTLGDGSLVRFSNIQLGDGGVINISSIPEPSAQMLISLAGMAGLLRRRKQS